MKINYPKKYLLILFTTSIILALIIILTNYLINPYQVFNNQFVDIKKKSAAQTQVRLSKAYQLNHMAPKTVILGTSRSAVGLDPNHVNLNLKPTYNLSIDGANLGELYSYLIHANQHKSIKQVILAADFMSFNQNMDDLADYSAKRLFPNRQYSQLAKDYFSSLFSQQALIDSYKTISNKFSPGLPAMNIYGQTLEHGIYSYQQQNGGHHATSIYSETNYVNNVWRPHNSYDYKFRNQDYTKFLDYCYSNNIELLIFISPTHARHRILIDQVGLWESFENFKRELVSINKLVATKYRAAEFAIWDFSVFSKITTESMPKITEPNTSMQWYWESAHYKQSLGNIILSTILGNDNNIPNNKDYAVKLQSENLEDVLAKIRQDKLIYNLTNQQEIAELKNIPKPIN